MVADHPRRYLSSLYKLTPGAKLANTALEALWLSVALLVPLWVNLWALQPFELSKVLLLRSLVWLMVGMWVAEALVRGGLSWRALQRNPLVWPLIALAAVQVAATIFAADWRLSVWGSYQRAQGILTLVSYILLFLVVSMRMRTPDQTYRLVGAMVVTTIPIACLSLVQAVGWDPYGLISDARTPLYATLGRANFVGAYLALLLPLILATTCSARQTWMRLGGTILLLVVVALVGLTRIRGAWLTAGASLGAFGLFWLWPRLLPYRRWLVMVSLGAGLISGWGLVWWLSQAQSGSIAARLTIWQATLSLIRAQPLLGNGCCGQQCHYAES